MKDDIAKLISSLLGPWISDFLKGEVWSTILKILFILLILSRFHPKTKSLIKFEKFEKKNLNKEIKGIIFTFVGMLIFYLITRLFK